MCPFDADGRRRGAPASRRTAAGCALVLGASQALPFGGCTDAGRRIMGQGNEGSPTVSPRPLETTPRRDGIVPDGPVGLGLTPEQEDAVIAALAGAYHDAAQVMDLGAAEASRALDAWKEARPMVNARTPW